MSVEIDQMELSDTGSAIGRSHTESLLKTTLDMLPIGIVLVDADALIVHSNAAATVMLRVGEPIVSRHGLLRACCTITTDALMAAIRQVALREGRPRMTGNCVPLPFRDGRAAIAHVQPLNLGVLRVGIRSAFAAAIFITEAREHTSPPLEALTTLFELTPSEACVLEQIVLGKNRREAAAALGVADSTVKTHLDHLYAKTGTSDQLGLCRLVAKLSWPTRSIGRD